jgi:Ser/Thr protein kinase RdoA (MazF antagonist)
VLARHAHCIAASYGCGPAAELLGPVARGEQGEVWRLETSSGSWAVKLLFEEPDLTETQADAAYQDQVLGAGVPMPRVRRTVDGDVLSRAGGSWVRVYEWIDLVDPDPELDPAAVGALIAAIHRVRSHSQVRPVDPWYAEPVGADRWDELLAALAARGAPFADALAELRDELVALERLLAPPRALQVCHRDLWADNVRRRPSGALCVIDWENGGLADPNQELAIVLFEFGLGDELRARALSDAYAGAGGPGRLEGAGDFSMLIAQLGHITERACACWLQPAASAADRARAADRVGEYTSRPVTREAIERLLTRRRIRSCGGR